jgi:hypothetical protein
MTGERRPGLPDEELDPLLKDPIVMAWFAEHVTELRRTASGQSILAWSLATALVAGLVAHIAGYWLRAMALAEPIGLLVDLIYALGYALWTGAVVVAFLQLYPEAKRRQIKRAIDAYDAAVRDKERPNDAGDPTAK